MRAFSTALIVGVSLPGFVHLQAAAPLRPGGAEQAQPNAHGDSLPPGAFARLGTERLRHGGQVTSVAFSSDGRLLASVGQDWMIRLWDPATGTEVRRLGSAVQAMALSADGKVAAAACKDGDAPPRRPW